MRRQMNRSLCHAAAGDLKTDSEVKLCNMETKHGMAQDFVFLFHFYDL